MEEVANVCVCKWICLYTRACDSSVGWVGWGTLVICLSHTVLSPPCPRLVHTKHITLITRPVGLRPGDRELLRPTGVCILCWCPVTSRTIQWLTSKITLEKKIPMVWIYFLAEMVMSVEVFTVLKLEIEQMFINFIFINRDSSVDNIIRHVVSLKLIKRKPIQLQIMIEILTPKSATHLGVKTPVFEFHYVKWGKCRAWQITLLYWQRGWSRLRSITRDIKFRSAPNYFFNRALLTKTLGKKIFLRIAQTQQRIMSSLKD